MSPQCRGPLMAHLEATMALVQQAFLQAVVFFSVYKRTCYSAAYREKQLAVTQNQMLYLLLLYSSLSNHLRRKI